MFLITHKETLKDRPEHGDISCVYFLNRRKPSLRGIFVNNGKCDRHTHGPYVILIDSEGTRSLLEMAMCGSLLV